MSRYWDNEFAAIDREIERVDGVRKKEAARRANPSVAMTRSPAYNKARVASREERAAISQAYLGMNKAEFCRRATVGCQTVRNILQGMPVGNLSIEKAVAFARGRELELRKFIREDK